MGRKILFVTTDQQRYDTLGCNGGLLARTPVIDALAAQGIRYEHAIPQSVVCMPSRATMITGQHPSSHGVWMNGVALSEDAPSVASTLHEAGYRTALIGKAHFEPFFDPFGRFLENTLSASGTTPPTGTHRGFEHLELATHGAMGNLHYARWIRQQHPEAVSEFYATLDKDLQVNAVGLGDTGAPQVKFNHIPKEWYHTDWVADRTISWLNSIEEDEDWFCWMSFPDPHHPWDPPQSEVSRVNWRDVELPAGYLQSAQQREAVLDAKPRHWRLWYDGTLVSNYEAPPAWVPATLTPDQIREVNARNAVEVELIDEALGRVLGAIAARGWAEDLDVVFTSDHGEFQGDFGLLFKGPYHVQSLMRLPLVWRPAPSAGVTPAVVSRPVGLIDLAPTFCSIAGVVAPETFEGAPLPTDAAASTRPVLTEWDSALFGVEVHLRTITDADTVCTTYLPGTVHDGSEGELYSLSDDPLQRENRFDESAMKPRRDELIDEMRELRPQQRQPRRPLIAPV